MVKFIDVNLINGWIYFAQAVNVSHVVRMHIRYCAVLIFVYNYCTTFMPSDCAPATVYTADSTLVDNRLLTVVCSVGDVSRLSY